MDGSAGAVGKKARRALLAALLATVVTAVTPIAVGQSFQSNSAADISGWPAAAQIRRISAPGRSVLSRNRPDGEHRPRLDRSRQPRGYKGGDLF